MTYNIKSNAKTNQNTTYLTPAVKVPRKRLLQCQKKKRKKKESKKKEKQESKKASKKERKKEISDSINREMHSCIYFLFSVISELSCCYR